MKKKSQAILEEEIRNLKRQVHDKTAEYQVEQQRLVIERLQRDAEYAQGQIRLLIEDRDRLTAALEAVTRRLASPAIDYRVYRAH